MLVVQDGSNLLVERLATILAHILFVFAVFDDIFVTVVWVDQMYKLNSIDWLGVNCQKC